MSYLENYMSDFFTNNRNPMVLLDTDTDKVIKTNKSYEKVFLNDESVLGQLRKRNGRTINKIRYGNTIYKVDRHRLNSTMQLIELPANRNVMVNDGVGDSDINRNHDMVSFKTLAQILPVGIIQTDHKFRIEYHNKQTKAFFGFPLSPAMSFIDLIYVEGVSDFWGKIEEMRDLNIEKQFQFSVFNQEEGKEIFINCTGRAIEFDKNYPSDKGYLFVLEDITDNKEFTEEITAKNLELNQMNHELDKFLYSVSHNIRGPVASMEGLLKVIEISSVEAVNELKHHLRLNLRLLHSFVNDINNVAINLHTHIKYEEIRLFDLFEELIIFKETIHEVKCDATFDLDMDYIIKTDKNRLTIVLKNILKNSFQYRDNNKSALKIKISAKKEVGFHVITIKDNGLGIEERAISRVFDMFYRGNENSTGNGMGLYNVREVLKKLGGRINLESENRKGTEVKIFLPVKPYT